MWPDMFGRVGCDACDERLRHMGIKEADAMNLVHTRWRVGEWMKSSLAGPGEPPHFHDEDPLKRQVGIIWTDERKTAPLAVTDDDGCQAIIVSEEPIARD